MAKGAGPSSPGDTGREGRRRGSLRGPSGFRRGEAAVAAASWAKARLPGEAKVLNSRLQEPHALTAAPPRGRLSEGKRSVHHGQGFLSSLPTLSTLCPDSPFSGHRCWIQCANPRPHLPRPAARSTHSVPSSPRGLEGGSPCWQGVTPPSSCPQGRHPHISSRNPSPLKPGLASPPRQERGVLKVTYPAPLPYTGPLPISIPFL